MLDFLKDNTEAWIDRVKSPVIGSVVFAFIAFNWKPLWYLVFADQAVTIKFRFFDLNTTVWSLYVFPLVVGIILAYLTPWIQFAGAFFAAFPIRKRRFLQSNETSKLRISQIADLIIEEEKKADLEAARAKTEAARDNRAIEASKRLDSAKSVGGEDAVHEVLTNREIDDFGRDQFLDDGELQLSNADEIILEAIAQTGVRVQVFDIPEELYQSLNFKFQDMFPTINEARIRAELESSLEKLRALNMAQKDVNGIWTLTSRGFSAADALRKSKL